MLRIGVFICWCGENISRTVDVKKVAEAAAEMHNVVYATDYTYMCSAPGQDLLKNAIKEHNLNGIIIAACSPAMHESTFRTAASEAGINPYLVEIANIREQCSWVHTDKPIATEKAIDLVRIMVGKVSRNYALQPIKVPITKRVLIIGGGIAGIQAALDCADAGYETIIVERSSSIGGKMAQLSETFPTLDCSQCILTPRMVEVAKHPNIKLYTYSEIDEVKGFIGNFEVKVHKKPRFVDMSKCTGCGDCWNKCPQRNIPNEFDEGLGKRTAIYVPFPQAIPNKPVIDSEHCLKLTNDKCGICAKVCKAQAIDYSQKDEYITEKVGAIIVATGFALYDFRKPIDGEYKGYGEYGYGKYHDIIDGLQFERLASASGPTLGGIVRPSDGKVAKSIAFISCVGSRDPSKGISYCSKICCMYEAKHAMLYKHKVPDGKAYVFYIDIRAGGKDYDEFVRRAIEEDDVNYIRGRVSRIYKEGDHYIIKATDTIEGTQIEVPVDMVVLATAMRAHPNAELLAQKLGIGYNQYKFYSEAHPKLRPVETNVAGIFLAGTCQGPKDIPETVAQASAAAAKVMALFSKNELERSPITALVNQNTCNACFNCERVCPYNAIEHKEIIKNGKVVKVVAYVNKGVCQGCGICVSACPSKSIDLEGYTEEQLFSEIISLIGD